MKFCDPNEKNFSSSPGLTPQKGDSYARRYVRVMHALCTTFSEFSRVAQKMKKVPKSADFGTFLVEISGIEPLTS